MRLKSALLSWFPLVSWRRNVWYDKVWKADFILMKVTLTAVLQESRDRCKIFSVPQYESIPRSGECDRAEPRTFLNESERTFVCDSYPLFLSTL